MKRLYGRLIRSHLKKYPQMLFLMGPRQVGKTTISQMVGEKWDHPYYFNWDDDDDRERILAGPRACATTIGLEHQQQTAPIVIFDEIHKHSKWKNFLKALYDRYSGRCHVIVTGSARLDVFRKGGDSLMGRYFYYRMHPLSVGELVSQELEEVEIRANPKKITATQWHNLWIYGGFPQPFTTATPEFYQLWKKLRRQQLFREDIRDLTQIQELDQVEMLAEMLRQNVATFISYSSLGKHLRAADDSIRRWIETLKSFYYCFEVRPWSKNVTRSLIKEPKRYLWDWSLVDDPGARFENMVASALLKAVHYWTDRGWGDYGLHYIRDKDKREVDFLVSKDNQPWFLVEAKMSSRESLSSALCHFTKELQPKHAFQVAYDMDFVDQDCFALHQPTIVSAQSFLSQLV